METAPAGVYEPRNPRATSLYALVEDYYEEFERVYDDRYQQQYGPWRPVIGEVMRKYLECGDLHRGFARLGCGGCRYQAILAYSCKCRLFCPACQQKRVLLFAEWLDMHILEQVSHAQYVFTIPKLLRPIFKYHRRELGLLCKSTETSGKAGGLNREPLKAVIVSHSKWHALFEHFQLIQLLVGLLLFPDIFPNHFFISTYR